MLLGFKPLATRQGCCELTPTPLPVILSFTAGFFSHSGSVPNIICSQPPCTHRHCVHHSAHTTVRQAESPRAACSQAAKPSEFLILLLQMLQFQVLALGVSTVPSALVRERQPHPPLISGQRSIKACLLELSACLWDGAEVIVLCRCYCPSGNTD